MVVGTVQDPKSQVRPFVKRDEAGGTRWRGLVVGRPLRLLVPRLALVRSTLLALEERLATEATVDPGDEVVGPVADRLCERPATAFLLPLSAEDGPPTAHHALLDTHLWGRSTMTVIPDTKSCSLHALA
ncbi:hypothetical protein MRX96_003381 [Rhipicephalus microplus]